MTTYAYYPKAPAPSPPPDPTIPPLGSGSEDRTEEALTPRQPRHLEAKSDTTVAIVDMSRSEAAA
jgi:hypothetical protein